VQRLHIIPQYANNSRYIFIYIRKYPHNGIDSEYLFNLSEYKSIFYLDKLSLRWGKNCPEKKKRKIKLAKSGNMQ
jgi:hypothetical protein